MCTAAAGTGVGSAAGEGIGVVVAAGAVLWLRLLNQLNMYVPPCVTSVDVCILEYSCEFVGLAHRTFARRKRRTADGASPRRPFARLDPPLITALVYRRRSHRCGCPSVRRPAADR